MISSLENLETNLSDIKELIEYVEQKNFSNRNPHDSNKLLFELYKDARILSNPKNKRKWLWFELYILNSAVKYTIIHSL